MTDWLNDPESAPSAKSDLDTLRRVLRRDYLTRADMSYALKDMAAMAKEALDARVALVAVLEEAPSQDNDPIPKDTVAERVAGDTSPTRAVRWVAHTASGEVLKHKEIAFRASVAVLEHVRETQAVMATMGEDALPISSKSISAHRVASVLAAPLFRWTRSTQQRDLAAVLYVDRSANQPAFAARHAELVRDLAEIASRNLNLLWQLASVEAQVERQHAELTDLRSQHAQTWNFGDWETQDAAFAEKVIAPLKRVAAFDRVQLLITGDTGTGKTTLARAFHSSGRRKTHPFVILDCAQVTSGETLAAELFGYAKNAGYQNAPPSGRPGKAELADGGTLFIDEVGTLPSELQQRLLALIQDGEFSRLGESQTRRVDLQILAATNEDLPARIAEGRFREDLYWRLNVLNVALPPLDERPADIPTLAARLLARAKTRHGRADLDGFSAAALNALVSHPWRFAGNVRGLERAIERAVLLAPVPTPHVEKVHLRLEAPAALSRPGQSSATSATRRPASSSAAFDPIRAAILEHKSARAAAEALGITYGKLIWHLRREGLGVRDVLRGEP